MGLNRLSLGLAVCLMAGLSHGLMLGGTNVPKEKIVVYLMIGHSNMAGIDHSKSDGVTHPRAWNYQWNTTKAWVPAKETPGNIRNGLSGRGSAGPSMPFLKQMAAAHPDYWFGVVNNASVSSTCRGENTGHNGSGMDPEDNRYWKGARLYNEILIAAKAIQAEVTLGGIICMLGSVEATRTPDSVCHAFSSDIAQLAKDFRADLNAPLLPFIMGEYEAGATGTFSPTLRRPSIIVAQTKLIPTKLENSVTIDSRGIAMLDDHHYTGNVGQQEFAKRTVAAIQDKKFFPPPAGMANSIKAGQARLPTLHSGAFFRFRDSPTLEFVAQDGIGYLIDGKLHNFKRTHAIIHP